LIKGPEGRSQSSGFQRRTGENLEDRTLARKIIMFKASDLGVSLLALLAVALTALLLLLPLVLGG